LGSDKALDRSSDSRPVTDRQQHRLCKRNLKTMKLILAIIKPFLAEKVIQNLPAKGIELVNIREVKGYGRQKNYLESYGENEYSLAFVPKVEISIWVEDPFVDAVFDRIVEVSRTGRLGDGKIMILPADQASLQ
jgi:nitrogen regulatory protein PII